MIKGPITVWIHGTRPQHFVPLLSHISSERLHRFLHCVPGLHPAHTYAPEYHHHTIAHSVSTAHPTLFPFELFYLFGWSGKLDSQERIAEAQTLYNSLETLRATYRELHKEDPFIRIITHSHGGNVALNLARVTPTNDPLIINELILLAVPVQKETEQLILHPMFKAIYSIHSHWDVLQVADPQGWPELRESIKKMFKVHTVDAFKDTLKTFEQMDLFSKRHFKPHDTLVQLHVKLKHRDLMHIEFLLKPFIHKIPELHAHAHKAQQGTVQAPRADHDIVIVLD